MGLSAEKLLLLPQAMRFRPAKHQRRNQALATKPALLV
jgi:hypothetical protein